MERIDIDPNGKGCTKIWVNTDVVSSLVPHVSTQTGLIYTQDRQYDAENDLYAVYWVALDFRTGKVVWEKLAGTFNKSGPATFDNFWAGINIGPNGALYAGQYAGVFDDKGRQLIPVAADRSWVQPPSMPVGASVQTGCVVCDGATMRPVQRGASCWWTTMSPSATG